MKRGKLYRTEADSWLCAKDDPFREFIGLVPKNSVIIWLSQSLFAPYTHKVIHGDQTGYILSYSFSEVDYAEPQT